ncbi:MAG: hypothetical protein MK080_04455 [Opitutales bacterium]|nr:hypothetical protein [Opitutales bacterium]NRA26843.1 hypothetical protein [Opitutales bacterium]
MMESAVTVSPQRRGLSLVEVIIAIGVFAFAMVTLIGLLGSTLTSISESLTSEEAAAVVSKVETFLQSYDLNPDVPKFQEVYTELQGNQYIDILVYNQIDGATVLVDGSQAADVEVAMNNTVVSDNVDGALFVALVTPAFSNPQNTVSATSNALPSPFDQLFSVSLNQTFADFDLGYLIMDVRIFSYDAPAPGQTIASLIAENPPSQSSELLRFSTVLNF